MQKYPLDVHFSRQKTWMNRRFFDSILSPEKRIDWVQKKIFAPFPNFERTLKKYVVFPEAFSKVIFVSPDKEEICVSFKCVLNVTTTKQIYIKGNPKSYFLGQVRLRLIYLSTAKKIDDVISYDSFNNFDDKGCDLFLYSSCTIGAFYGRFSGISRLWRRKNATATMKMRSRKKATSKWRRKSRWLSSWFSSVPDFLSYSDTFFIALQLLEKVTLLT